MIEELERLVDDPTTDELHQLQPLFKNGLWIFGAEYDFVEFTSNRSLTTVIRNLLHGSDDHPLDGMERKRPDFVVLPDCSIGIYCRDGYDAETGDVQGIEKVLIIELKRGGFEITNKEVLQVNEYAMAIRDSRKLVPGAKIICFVLGTKVAQNAQKMQFGENNETVIFPRAYTTVLRLANARTFSLSEKIREFRDDLGSDPEVAKVLREPKQITLPET